MTRQRHFTVHETLFIDVSVVANVVITAISVSDQGNKDCVLESGVSIPLSVVA